MNRQAARILAGWAAIGAASGAVFTLAVYGAWTLLSGLGGC